MERELLQIFNDIVSKYESSSKFINDTQGNIFVRLIEDTQYCESLNRFKINEALLNLKRQGKLEISWYDRNNIIEKIKINSSDIDYFYGLTGKCKKKDIIDNYIEIVEQMAEKYETDWIKSYLNDILSLLQQKKIYKHMEKILQINKALFGIEDMLKNSSDDMLMRVFSKKYFKNSKIFADEVKDIIISILRNYHPMVDKSMDDDIVLEQIGIIKTSNDLYIKGNLMVELEGEIIDISKFKYGVGLNKYTIKKLRIHHIGEIKEVISIENKANFLSENYENDKIIVFSHGYFAPYERKFLLMLKDLLPVKTEYYHSGDIDLGGFNIYKHIKTHIFPKLKPKNMDKDMYIKFLEYGEKASDSYLKKLSSINLEEFTDLIKIMQKEKIIIEQESFLIETR